MNRTKNVNKFITNDCLGYLQAIFFWYAITLPSKILMDGLAGVSQFNPMSRNI